MVVKQLNDHNIRYNVSGIYDCDYCANHDQSFIASTSKCRYVPHPRSMATTLMNKSIGIKTSGKRLLIYRASCLRNMSQIFEFIVYEIRARTSRENH
jgi:hypothetical protein